MTRMPPLDPEVLADQYRRELIARDAHREESPAKNPLAKSRPVYVGAWKCRKCDALVPIQESDMDFLATWNDVLRARGEAPIDPHSVMFCDACRTKYKSRDFQLDRARGNRDRTERLAEAIRRIKGAANPDGEHETIRALRELGHPDVDGLLSLLREKAANTKSKPTRGTKTHF